MEAWCQKFSKLLFRTSHPASNLQRFINSHELRIETSITGYDSMIPKRGHFRKESEIYFCVRSVQEKDRKTSKTARDVLRVGLRLRARDIF